MWLPLCMVMSLVLVATGCSPKLDLTLLPRPWSPPVEDGAAALINGDPTGRETFQALRLSRDVFNGSRAYKRQTGSPPTTFDDLQQAGLLFALPVGIDGVEIPIETVTGDQEPNAGAIGVRFTADQTAVVVPNPAGPEAPRHYQHDYKWWLAGNLSRSASHGIVEVDPVSGYSRTAWEAGGELQGLGYYSGGYIHFPRTLRSWRQVALMHHVEDLLQQHLRDYGKLPASWTLLEENLVFRSQGHHPIAAGEMPDLSVATAIQTLGPTKSAFIVRYVRNAPQLPELTLYSRTVVDYEAQRVEQPSTYLVGASFPRAKTLRFVSFIDVALDPLPDDNDAALPVRAALHQQQW